MNTSSKIKTAILSLIVTICIFAPKIEFTQIQTSFDQNKTAQVSDLLQGFETAMFMHGNSFRIEKTKAKKVVIDFPKFRKGLKEIYKAEFYKTKQESLFNFIILIIGPIIVIVGIYIVIFEIY